MRILVAAVVAFVAIGCGKEIGDACIVSSDCSPNGDRQCDSLEKDGYCTIQGCDYSTCPSEAECVRFFTGSFHNRPCNPMTEDKTSDDCSLDELCSQAMQCVPRSSEVRYCMRKCSQASDCRTGYECRGLMQWQTHGGEPVLSPGTPVDNTAPSFCAAAPAPI
ncbi:MAG: hypothetical protein JWO36_7340 [Myxococcales bacterium]|nr:hypothetical protein [Myxococcales bacterium]